MEWIKSKYETHPKSWLAVALGWSLLSLFAYRRYITSKPKFTVYCQSLNKIIIEKFRDNHSIKYMPTEEVIHNDSGIDFALKHLVSLKDRPSLKEQNFDKELKKSDDPFAKPYDQSVVITEDLTDEHAMLFNKFPITSSHVLVITKEFVHQKTPLTLNDVKACLIAMRSVENGFIFYNCGKVSGASQPHKHMQWFPETNFEHTKCLPISNAIEKYVREQEVDLRKPFMLPQFEFLHEIRYFEHNIRKLLEEEKLEKAAQDVFETYQEMYKALEITEDMSYNIFFTQSYLMIIPRVQEKSQGISLNTLAFTGSFFCSTPDKLKLIKDFGPINMLREITVPLKR